MKSNVVKRRRTRKNPNNSRYPMQITPIKPIDNDFKLEISIPTGMENQLLNPDNIVQANSGLTTAMGTLGIYSYKHDATNVSAVSCPPPLDENNYLGYSPFLSAVPPAFNTFESLFSPILANSPMHLSQILPQPMVASPVPMMASPVLGYHSRRSSIVIDDLFSPVSSRRSSIQIISPECYSLRRRSTIQLGNSFECPFS
jgi:hypothetical protein